MLAFYQLICQEASKHEHYAFDYVMLKNLKACIFSVFWCSASNYILKTISSLCARVCDWMWFKVVVLFLLNFINSTKGICIRNSALASWEIDRASAEDEGLYECIAQSKAGQGRALTQLNVRGMSPTIAKLRSAHASAITSRLWFKFQPGQTLDACLKHQNYISHPHKHLF